MTFHLRIPGLVDIGVVDRAPLVFEVDAKRGWGASSTELPRAWADSDRQAPQQAAGRQHSAAYVRDRDAVAAALLDALERHFEAVDFEAHTSAETWLASVLRGQARRRRGRASLSRLWALFDPGFRERFVDEDAWTIAEWVTRPSPRAAWTNLTGKLDRARDRMWRLCRQDRMMLHGTVLALRIWSSRSSTCENCSRGAPGSRSMRCFAGVSKDPRA